MVKTLLLQGDGMAVSAMPSDFWMRMPHLLQNTKAEVWAINNRSICKGQAAVTALAIDSSANALLQISGLLARLQQKLQRSDSKDAEQHVHPNTCNSHNRQYR